MKKFHLGSGGQRRTRGEKTGQTAVCVFLTLLSFIMIYPLWHVFMYSISDPIQAMEGGIFLLPRGFDTYNYRMIFKTSQIWVSMRNSLSAKRLSVPASACCSAC